MRGIRMLFAAAVIGSSVAAVASAAGPWTPIVYEDDYILVGAGVVEAGLVPIHLGDTLTLRIEVEFDPRHVQIEKLDGAYFERAFSAMSSVRLRESDGPSSITEVDGRVRLATSRQFQFLECPPEMSRCPGSKQYEMSVMTMAYRVADPGGGPASNRSARFRPWPGIVAIAPSIRFGDSNDDLESSLPGEAYPEPQPVAAREAVGPVMLLAGGLLLATGWYAGARRPRTSRLASSSRTARLNRWQRALAALADAGLSDEEWCDLLRRSVVWYCRDELQRNPYDWLSPESEQIVDPDAGELRPFFLELLHEVGIERTRRDHFLARFATLSDHPLAAEHRTA